MYVYRIKKYCNTGPSKVNIPTSWLCPTKRSNSKSISIKRNWFTCTVVGWIKRWLNDAFYDMIHFWIESWGEDLPVTVKSKWDLFHKIIVGRATKSWKLAWWYILCRCRYMCTCVHTNGGPVRYQVPGMVAELLWACCSLGASWGSMHRMLTFENIVGSTSNNLIKS